MKHFTVGDDFSTVDTCQVCCCEQLSLQPGTTSRVSISYAPWAVPIGRLHCVPQFQLEQMVTCPVPITGNLPPGAVGNLAKFETPVSTLLEDDLTTEITDPENDTLTFKLLPFYAPKQGKLDLNADGTFAYTPRAGYQGEDRFFVSVSDGINTKVIEVVIGIAVSAAPLKETPHIVVGTPTVDDRYFTASFPVTVSPAADMCEVWRLTVLQAALDCACACFTRTDCFDIKMAKC